MAGTARFLDKTLNFVSNIAERHLSSEDCARQKGLLQDLDIRVKLVTFLLFIVLASLLHTPAGLGLWYGVSLLMAAASRVPLGPFLRRVWLVVPLFSAAIVLPATLNIITPGEHLWVLVRLDQPWTWGPYTIPQEIAVTRQGLHGAAIFLLRVAASVSFAVLLTLTSSWTNILSGLRSLFVPPVFVTTISMAYRYVFVFLRLLQDMYRGRKSRTIRPASAASARHWTASRIGVTFVRSLRMGEDIFQAMISRGFRGEHRTLDRSSLRRRDIIWLVTAPVFGGIFFMIERGIL